MMQDFDFFCPLGSDYDEITKVWEASVRATHHFLSESDILLFRSLIRDKYLKNATLYAVRTNERRIVAFMGVAGDMLEMLFIHPDVRGRGIGKRLAEYAVRELHITFVDANEQNEQAVGFYKHIGFEVVGRDETDGLGKPFPILHLRLKEIL